MKLLDLFCGAGGAAKGYADAGSDEIVGVDIKDQPRYPYEFVREDAMSYLIRHGHEFDAIHASPPCQGYSVMNNLPWLKHREYPLLILPIYDLLEELGKPYVIENVMGARHGAKGLTKRGLEAHGLKAGWLCGQMFGLPFYRHRLFATNWLWLAPGHPKHKMNLHPRSERFTYGGTVKGLPGGAAGLDAQPRDPFHDENGKSILGPGHLGKGSGLLPWQNGNGAQANGVGIGHAKGWRLAAKAMGIDWMRREELTQAIPPAYTQFIGERLLNELAFGSTQ